MKNRMAIAHRVAAGVRSSRPPYRGVVFKDHPLSRGRAELAPRRRLERPAAPQPHLAARRWHRRVSPEAVGYRPPMTTASLPRCPWAGGDALMTAYHDEDWGVPVHDDVELFERLA